MRNSSGIREAARHFGFAIALGMASLWGVAGTASRTDAMCCACLGLGCDTCADAVDFVDCAALCMGCNSSVANVVDDCEGGCGSAAEFPTMTPSDTPTETPTETPSASPPTETPTATPTSSPTFTPTPLRCCECAGSGSCGPAVGSEFVDFCSPGCTPFLDHVCQGAEGKCVTPTKTRTPTPTKTPTDTPTPKNTFPPVPNNIDPYKCYRIKEQKKYKERVVTYTDEFETKRTRVLKPFLLCSPAAPSDPSVAVAEVTPIPPYNPGGSLVCYKSKDDNSTEHQPKFQNVPVKIQNVPNPETMVVVEESYDVRKSFFVCIPSAVEH